MAIIKVPQRDPKNPNNDATSFKTIPKNKIIPDKNILSNDVSIFSYYCLIILISYLFVFLGETRRY